MRLRWEYLVRPGVTCPHDGLVLRRVNKPRKRNESLIWNLRDGNVVWGLCVLVAFSPNIWIADVSEIMKQVVRKGGLECYLLHRVCSYASPGEERSFILVLNCGFHERLVSFQSNQLTSCSGITSSGNKQTPSPQTLLREDNPSKCPL